MRRATVIASDVGGRGNKLFKYGQEVTENNFPPGNFSRLIERGFLKEIIEEKNIAMTGNPNAKPGPKLQSGETPGMSGEEIDLKDVKAFESGEETEEDEGRGRKRKRR